MENNEKLDIEKLISENLNDIGYLDLENRKARR